jgi:hypothetical protein
MKWYSELSYGGTINMDDRLRDLMQELGNAINESLSDSERIAAAVGKIKQAGYDVFLVIEATIGFNKREESEVGDTPDDSEVKEQKIAFSEGQLKWTSQDRKFARALKINIDGEQV